MNLSSNLIKIIILTSENNNYKNLFSELKNNFFIDEISNYFDSKDKINIYDYNFLIIDYNSFNNLKPILEDFSNNSEIIIILLINENYNSNEILEYLLNNKIDHIANKNNLIDKLIKLSNKENSINYFKEQIISYEKKIKEKENDLYNFLSSINQELKKPINAIVGFLQLISKTNLTLKQNEYFSKIQYNINNLIEFVNDLADFSEIETGKFKVEFSDFKINDIFSSIANMIGIKCLKQNIEVIYNISNEIPNHLNGPLILIEQIIYNLSDILISFSNNGEISYFVDKKDLSNEEIELKFQIISFCCYIDEDNQNNINKILNNYESSLDLINNFNFLFILELSKKISNILNSKILFKQIQDQTFLFEISIKCYIMKKEKNYSVPENIRGMKILLVDNNEISRDYLNEILTSMSFRVSLKTNVQEAISELENTQESYKLFILEINISNIENLSIINNIKTNFLIKEKPKIIIITAYGREYILRNINNLSIDSFLIKPINPDILLETIINLFSEPDINPEYIENITELTEEEINSSEQIKNLPGIDVNSGLKRVGGNINLYRTILLKFYNSHKNIINLIKENIEKNKFKEIYSILNNLKNISYNIGAFELYEKLKEIVEILKSDLTFSYDLFSDIEISIIKVLNSISILDRRSSRLNQDNENKERLIITTEELDIIENLLKSNDIKVLNYLILLKNKLENSFLYIDLKNLISYIEAMDFKNGIQSFEIIRKKLRR